MDNIIVRSIRPINYTVVVSAPNGQTVTSNVATIAVISPPPIDVTP
jgi:hypothetical protein